MREHGGRARITGRHARNLNPLIFAGERSRELRFAWWWLHVGGSPAKFSAFNSRSDALVAKWRTAFQRRAIAPAAWFDEKGARFALAGQAFGMAAITTSARTSAGEALDTYSIVTREAVGAVAPVHNRMPLLVPRELHDAWLDPERVGDAELIGAVVSASDELSRALDIVTDDEVDEDTPALF
ncbi:MAG TPA: SOS response-associated peptidase [Candidatus Agrococcus pullicola]|uniref:Abasic site processing protein n=1 Tax=Candidatus Agrococcus pullicola TaxID=2838429 RepID=A0A9D1YWE0_9MICO|nr:SOS response-associated peptidase [Candidatus Agrococcus pullicola]